MDVIRMLYAENDPADRELTLYYLRECAADFQVRIADTGREVLETLQDEIFDAILLDCGLPDVEGLQFLREVVSRTPHAPVLMVTGAGDYELAVAALKSGAADYVIKRPGYLNHLPSAIRDAIKQFRYERSRRAAGLRVLYAEHDSADADLALRHLAIHAPHMQVETVGTGAFALQRLRMGTYDLLLLNYRMPGMNGIEVLQAMRACGIRVPVVVVTGHGDEETAVQALKLGALDYVVKREGYLRQLPSTIGSAVARQALINEKEALFTLNGLAVKVASTLDLDGMLYQVASASTTLLRTDHALVFRLNHDGVELIPAAWHGIPAEVASRLTFRFGQDVPGQVAATREVVSARDIRQDETAIYRELAVPDRVGSVLGAPMLARGKLVGVLTVSTAEPRTFTPSEEMLLTALAAHAAVGIENAQLFAQVRQHTAELEARVLERTRELESANQQLSISSRYESEFLAQVSHELRTPLNSILGFSELLLDPGFGVLTEKQARFSEHIQTSGAHLLALINDLLDLSKVEAGKIEYRPETFECREAIQAAVAEIRSQADIKRLDLQLYLDDAPSTLTVDPVRFKQILLKLLSNAVKFTPECGRITVTTLVRREAEGVRREELPHSTPCTLYPGDFVEITVTDTGIGIKPDDLPRLFQEFVRFDAAKSRRIPGTGLGLLLTKKLVEFQGGEIVAASEGEGRGSSFTVRLPITSCNSSLR